MEVGAGPGIGDAGGLAQGDDQGGTEGASGGMIGVTPGAGPGSGNAITVEAFSKALNKVLGQQKAAQDAYYGGTIDQSQLDDPTDDSPAFNNEMDMTGPASQEDVDTGVRTVRAHPSRDTRIGMPMGVGRPATTDQEQNREPVDMYGRVAPIEDIEDPKERELAYEMLGKLQKAAKEARTPWGKALNTIMGYGMNALPGIGTLNMIGKAIKAGFAKAGFNVDPNIIGQAIRAAHEQTTQGPLGAGGTSVGSRNDSFIENFLDNIPASSYDEPWMKGLNERQIKYYLDRPSELEWVRNLYNEMNPMSPSLVTPTS